MYIPYKKYAIDTLNTSHSIFLFKTSKIIIMIFIAYFKNIFLKP